MNRVTFWACRAHRATASARGTRHRLNRAVERSGTDRRPTMPSGAARPCERPSVATSTEAWRAARLARQGGTRNLKTKQCVDQIDTFPECVDKPRFHRHITAHTWAHNRALGRIARQWLRTLRGLPAGGPLRRQNPSSPKNICSISALNQQISAKIVFAKL